MLLCAGKSVSWLVAEVFSAKLKCAILPLETLIKHDYNGGKIVQISEKQGIE